MLETHAVAYGSFVWRGRRQIGVALGDGRVLRLSSCPLSGPLALACHSDALTPLMALGEPHWSELAAAVPTLAQDDRCIPLEEADMRLPARIGDYTDFYASIHHAERVGRRFRPDNPLLPNYRHVPIAYHGRASSIVVSGAPIHRPHGQLGEGVFGPTQKLDFELELGVFIGPGNRLGEAIPIEEAERHIFGYVLVNDWSARDIQAWEYQPLGPFLGKSFATSISAWVIPAATIHEFQIPAPRRDVLPYLQRDHDWLLNLELEAWRNGERITITNAKHLHWTFSQMIAHHTSNGCNLRPGDLLATGTISGPEPGSEGCLLEKDDPWLEDGDEIVLTCPKAPLANVMSLVAARPSGKS